MLGNTPLLASAYSFGDAEDGPVFDLPIVREYEKTDLIF